MDILDEETIMDTETVYTIGFLLILVGIVIAIIAFVLIFASGLRRKGKIRGGGVIIIGPVPIIFGTDKESVRKILWLSIVLTIIVVIASIVMYLVAR